MTQMFPGSLEQLIGEKYCAIVIPRKGVRMLNFSNFASRPQGVGIYGPNHLMYAERYSTANFENSVILENHHDTDDVTYYLAGFAFYPAPEPEGQWIQSKVREYTPNVKIGFDDYMNDGDYNDLVVDISYVQDSDEQPPRRPHS